MESPFASLVDRFPWELIPELAPLVRGKLISRAVFRTPEGIAVDAWVDERLGPLMETALAWSLLDQGKSIYTVPREWIKCPPADPGALRLSLPDMGRLSLLFDTERHRWLHPRLPHLVSWLLHLHKASSATEPLTIERLNLIPHAWRLTRPQPPRASKSSDAQDRLFYGKKWLLKQLWQELRRSPVPGSLKRKPNIGQ